MISTTNILFGVLVCIQASAESANFPYKRPYEEFMQELSNSGSGETARVINGKAAVEGQFPYTVALFNDEHGFICTASRIAIDTVLTAAHCVVLEGQTLNASKFEGGFGSISRSASTKVRFIDLFVHPEYNTETFDNDIAIFKMDPDEIPYSNTSDKICIAKKETERNQYKNAIVMGWGRTSNASPFTSENMQYVDVGVMDQDTCKRRFPSVDGGVTENNICEFGNGKGACNGDSGGPMSSVIGKQGIGGSPVQIGIGSYVLQIAQVPRCADRYFPSVFTRVSMYEDWIKSHSGNDTCTE